MASASAKEVSVLATAGWEKGTTEVAEDFSVALGNNKRCSSSSALYRSISVCKDSISASLAWQGFSGDKEIL